MRREFRHSRRIVFLTHYKSEIYTGKLRRERKFFIIKENYLFAEKKRRPLCPYYVCEQVADVKQFTNHSTKLR